MMGALVQEGKYRFLGFFSKKSVETEPLAKNLHSAPSEGGSNGLFPIALAAPVGKLNPVEITAFGTIPIGFSLL